MPNSQSPYPTIGVLSGQQVYSARLSQFLGPVFRGIAAGAQQHACNVLFACGISLPDAAHRPRPAWPTDSPDSDFVPVGPWNTDVLLAVLPLLSADRSAYLQQLIADDFPVVFIGAGEDGPTVAPDNLGGVQAAVTHLVEHGHRRIAFIGGIKEDPGDSSERLQGYREGLAINDLPFVPEWVAYGNHHWHGGNQAMKQLLECSHPFTAVMVSNDESARGALAALHEAGRQVPQDVALVSFDDAVDSVSVQPVLTSVSYPMFEAGQHAVKLALEVLESRVHRSTSSPATLIRVPTSLVIRQSCGCRPDVERLRSAGLQPEPGLDFSSQLAEALAAAVSAETHSLAPDILHAMCSRLARAWLYSIEQQNGAAFLEAFREIMSQVERQHGDPHAWQAAISVLGCQHASFELFDYPEPPDLDDWLHRARIAASESTRRQYGAHIIQQWVDDHVERLTSRLVAAQDEAQIAAVLAEELPLAEDLPDVCIRDAYVALFEAEGTDQAAHSVLLTDPCRPSCRFATRAFPPDELRAPGEPFTFSLFPLVFQGYVNVPGFVALDMPGLSPYAAFIVQDLAVGLSRARLYQEAMTGRQAAEEANRLKTHFLSVVSHELRTPLSVIVGLTEMALHQQVSGAPPLPDYYRRDLERIYASAQHLSGLIGDVLDLASSQTGQLKFTPELLDLMDVLRPIGMVGEHMARSKGLDWQVEWPAAPVHIYGDRTRLRQITLNLVNNAIKFTAQGSITLMVALIEDRVRVSIADTGLGIPLSEQEAIFDEFRQSERTSGRGYGGVGLGLAICKRLVELHGGYIGVYSSGEEDAGSTFYFDLPLAPPAGALSDAPPRAAWVLLLHEVTDTEDAVRSHLARRGYQLQEDRLDAVEDWWPRVLAAPPEAVVLNLRPDSERGWEVFRLFKENPATRGVPVLFASMVAGAAGSSWLELDYLSKPLHSAELAEALGRQPAMLRTILVVDDEPAVRELHVRMVQEHVPHCRILQARDGREALRMLRDNRVDLVLLDLMMPNVDGFAVLEALRENESTRDVPVIVLTAQLLNETQLSRLNHGMAKVLGKGIFT
ncbi:MAG: substrate-binding domain-containing protein, partial [Anaerolineae bacterium]|nr:substrate-binding domain-containing protein [Anaerolineae bacterium]